MRFEAGFLRVWQHLEGDATQTKTWLRHREETLLRAATLEMRVEEAEERAEDVEARAEEVETTATVGERRGSLREEAEKMEVREERRGRGIERGKREGIYLDGLFLW